LPLAARSSTSSSRGRPPLSTADYQRQWLETLARAAAIAVEEGHFRADLDTGQFAYDLYALALARHHFGRLLRDPEAEDRAHTAFARQLVAARATT
jgi:hypothetical protein